jgi:hypothetical protein
MERLARNKVREEIAYESDGAEYGAAKGLVNSGLWCRETPDIAPGAPGGYFTSYPSRIPIVRIMP